MKYIIANWKSNKTSEEVKKWFVDFSKPWKTRPTISNITVVICPSLVHLSLCQSLIREHSLPFKLGAQNVSAFSIGSYTGEVAAMQLKGLVEYVIIGHSERRKYLTESDDILTEKMKRAHEAGLIPVLCVQGTATAIPSGIEMIAYEPVASIGTGNAQNSSEAEAVAEGITSKYPLKVFLYGGSVTEENIDSYLHEEMINGVLVGGASLDPVTFFNLIQKASQQK